MFKREKTNYVFEIKELNNVDNYVTYQYINMRFEESIHIFMHATIFI